jgi:hypothetical protein
MHDAAAQTVPDLPVDDLAGAQDSVVVDDYPAAASGRDVLAAGSGVPGDHFGQPVRK